MKTFRNVFHRALVLCAGLSLLGGALGSCKDNDDVYEKAEAVISPSDELTFSAEGGEQQLILETNRAWEVSTGSADFVTIEPKQGNAGKHTLTVTALANKGNKRSLDIVFSIGESKNATLKKTLKLTQASAENPEKPEEPKLEGMPLADFIKKYGSVTEDTNVDEDAFIQAAVISDLKANNVPNNKLITVQAGEVGLVVAFNKPLTPKGQEPLYKRGDLVKINLKGTKITTKYGFQLDVSSVENAVEKIGTMDVQPKVLTLQEVFSGRYQNILVQIDNVQFTKPGKPLNDLKPTGKSKYPLKHNAITDCVTPLPTGIKGISVEISYFANALKTQIASDRKGSITGILQHKGEYYNLWIRDFNDLNLTGEPCKIEDTPAPQPNPEPVPQPEVEVAMTIAQFIQKYESKTVTENVVISGSLLFDITKDNYRVNNLIIHDGDKGLVVYLPGLTKTVVNTLQRGAVVNVYAKGASVELYNGSIQLNMKAVPNNIAAVKSANQMKEITPKEITLGDVYSGNYENTLVTIRDVQFATESGNYAQYNPITNCSVEVPAGEQAVQVALNKNFALVGKSIKSMNGSMTGILTRYVKDNNKTWNLWIRDDNDLSLTAKRCGETKPAPDKEEDSKPAPNPEPTPNADGDVMIISYVEGSGHNKYIAIYNPTTKAVDLKAGKYSISLETFTGTNEKGKGKDQVMSLTDKIEPQQIIVYGFSKSGSYTNVKSVNRSVINFNGNDNIALQKNGVIIDMIGKEWGAAWIENGQPAGADKTLHRKISINKPNAKFDLNEWDVLGKDDVSKLGQR